MDHDGRQRVQSDATGDNRREEMLRAAMDVIAERGFGDTRIADVAERAGSSPALVIYYFQTKDNLLTEAVRLAEDLWYDFGYKRLETATDAIGRISVVIDTMFVPPAQLGFPPLGALWVELWGRSLRHPDVARVREEFDSQWRQVIAGVVVQGQASGEFGPADPDQFAIALSALLDGLSVQLALEDPAVSPATAFRIAMGYASGQLGFAWGPGDHPPVPVGAPVVTA